MLQHQILHHRFGSQDMLESKGLNFPEGIYGQMTAIKASVSFSPPELRGLAFSVAEDDDVDDDDLPDGLAD